MSNNAAQYIRSDWSDCNAPMFRRRYRHTLMVDGHFAMASTRGDNYHLDLDGILFLGMLVPSQHLWNVFPYFITYVSFQAV